MRFKGLVLTMASLAFYFYFPINYLLGPASDGTTSTLSYWYGVCHFGSDVGNSIIPNCQVLSFASYFVFILTLFGVVMLIFGKGKSKKHGD